MNKAQWLWEIESLREREKEEQDRLIDGFKIARKTIIQLFGLDLIRNFYLKGEDDTNEEDQPFLPLIMATGREEIVNYLWKKIEDESRAMSAIEDESFDKLSEAIASGEADLGDMTPQIDEDQIKQAVEDQRRRQLESLGIKLRERPESQKPAHFSIDTKTMQEKSEQQKKETQQANEAVEKLAEQQRKEGKRKLVTFDA